MVDIAFRSHTTGTYAVTSDSFNGNTISFSFLEHRHVL